MKILVLSLPGLGNTLLLTPMLEELKKNHKDSKITVLVMYKSCQEILKNNPNVDEVILFEFLKQGYFKSFRFLMKLRKQKFDLSILPHPSNRFEYNLVSFFAGAKNRISHIYPYFKLKSLGYLNNKRAKLLNMHEVDENLNLLELININPTPKSKIPFLKLDNSYDKYSNDFFKSNNLKGLVIGIHAGSSNYAGMQHKRWSKENFAALSNDLIKKYKSTILIFGGSDEKDLKDFIYNSIEKKDKCLIINTNSILETASLIKKCDYFITNDSGLMHIASALNVPIIGISGIVDYKRTHPLNNNSGMLFSSISCYPCYKFGESLHCKRKEKDYKCLKDISIYNTIALFDKVRNNENMGPVLERV